MIPTFFYPRVDPGDYFASKGYLVTYSRKLLSVSPINLKNATETSCRKIAELYLPREEDPGDCIKYVWIYIIWRNNQNVNFIIGKKNRISYMCTGPSAFLGLLLLSDLHGNLE